MIQKKRGGTLQIKIIIIGILVGCSYLIGNYIYKSYEQRHIQVKELIRILETMRMDLCFGMSTLQEIFNKIGCRTEYSTATFFKTIGEELERNSEIGIKNILQNNIQLLKENKYLRSREIDELIELILSLGRSDFESQSRMIDLGINNLKQITEDTREDIQLKGTVYKKLATIGGIIVGIILI